MSLFELNDLLNNLSINPTEAQLNLLYAEFKRDFIDSQLTINEHIVKVILNKSTVEGFEKYPETFVHLITRKNQPNQRVFDRHRANKIHWIRCILENRNEEEIIYFEYPETDGNMRDYYWYKDEGFLVIMERITPNYMVITSFHIDDKRTEKHFEKRLQWYLKKQGIKNAAITVMRPTKSFSLWEMTVQRYKTVYKYKFVPANLYLRIKRNIFL